ncbi:stress-related protein-like isoform X2 [Asparagus officinalis]|uniref:stress-related protein-like isoform X2 n=1 Tax=Asparagus officinalis TaxID=4686 RepID=UPI00098E739D|nr:stress-related protein-like isoform X2 [Asparagus officinalis]
MAESEVESDQISVETDQTKMTEEERLQYLEFVHLATIQALMYVSRLYGFARENSGPLKPGVKTVEGTVKAVVGPVYEKFSSVPLDVLKFVDRKVGDAVEEIDRHVPSLIKEASTQAYTAAQKAPVLARSLSNEVQRTGVVGTAKELARAAISKGEPVAEQYAVSTWRSLNKLPVFPQVAGMVIPTAARWTERYNRAVCYSAEKGYPVAGYLPVVPTERIAKVFGGEEKGKRVE